MWIRCLASFHWDQFFSPSGWGSLHYTCVGYLFLSDLWSAFKISFQLSSFIYLFSSYLFSFVHSGSLLSGSFYINIVGASGDL